MIERDEIETVVKEAKPNVKAKSRKVYVNNILRVMKKYENTYDKKITSFHFLEDMENVKKILRGERSKLNLAWVFRLFGILCLGFILWKLDFQDMSAILKKMYWHGNQTLRINMSNN